MQETTLLWEIGWNFTSQFDIPRIGWKICTSDCRTSPSIVFSATSKNSWKLTMYLAVADKSVWFVSAKKLCLQTKTWEFLQTKLAKPTRQWIRK